MYLKWGLLNLRSNRLLDAPATAWDDAVLLLGEHWKEKGNERKIQTPRELLGDKLGDVVFW